MYTMAAATECEVCYENSTKIVECKMCEYKACQECCKKYLLSTIKEAHCMNCKGVWTLHFLLEAFPKTWVTGTKEGGYRHHKKIINVELERARIPEVLAEIELERKNEEIDKEIEVMHDALLKKYSECERIKNKMRKLRNSKYTPRKDASGKNFNFLCPCPHEECRGLVLTESCRCTVCEGYVCKRCREPKKFLRTETKMREGKEVKVNVFERHRCSEDAIKSISLIKTDTKACPKCATPIHRISGCPQMWCTQCRVAFNWNTGKEETGTIHNPHALAWMRRNGDLPRDPADVPCGGLPDLYHLNLSSYFIGDKIERIYGNVNHLTHNIEVLNNYDAEDKLKSIRKEYIKGKIDEKEWQNKIFRVQSHAERNRIKSQILETLRTICIDAFRELNEDKSKNREKKFLERIQEIQLFINETIERELPSYGTTTDKLLYDEELLSIKDKLIQEERKKKGMYYRW